MLLNSADFIYDKCPGYLNKVPEILKNTYYTTPVFVILKNGKRLYHSYVVKRSFAIDKFKQMIRNLIEMFKTWRNVLPTNVSVPLYVFEYEQYVKNNNRYNRFIMSTMRFRKDKLTQATLSIENFHRKMRFYGYAEVLTERTLVLEENINLPDDSELIALLNNYDALLNERKVKI